MVEFTFLSLDDRRLTTNIKANFLNVEQLVGWELIDNSGRGLVFAQARSTGISRKS